MKRSSTKGISDAFKVDKYELFEDAAVIATTDKQAYFYDIIR